MWQPEADWTRLRGSGPGTLGVWRLPPRPGAPGGVVKRLSRPGPHDAPERHDPSHPGWWRREAEVATASLVTGTPGLRSPSLLWCDEDEDGITLCFEDVRPTGIDQRRVAYDLGRLAGHTGEWEAGGVATNDQQFQRRLDSVARRGGWQYLGRTTAADMADVVWGRRSHVLDSMSRAPQVLQHQDVAPSNMVAQDAAVTWAVDWAGLGRGAIGCDVGYWALATGRGVESLVDDYVAGLGEAAPVSRDQVLFHARAVLVFTLMTRIDWTLSRVAPGEGPLAAKFTHPAVAGHLRALAVHSQDVTWLALARPQS